MNNKVSTSILIILLYFFWPGPVSAYDNTRTHRDLTLQVVKESSLRDYLINELEIQGDLEKILKGHGKEQKISGWLQEGAEMEDNPACRASNHFHDPNRLWPDAGLSDTFWLTSGYCSLGDYSFGVLASNLVWATGLAGAGQDIPTPTGNRWDWNAARRFFYAALSGDSSDLNGVKIEEGKWPWQKTTISGGGGLKAPERDKYLAWTFRALGNVLHLLQDVSVPAHVRNDFLSHRTINGLDRLQPTEWGIGNPYEHYVKHHNDIILNTAPEQPNFRNPRLAHYWDSDDLQNRGLAEWANRTFFSAATIPNNNPEPGHVFPEPSLGPDTHHICEAGLPGKPETLRQYISRIPCPAAANDPVDHFAAVSTVNEDAEIIPANIGTLHLVLSDDNVLADYAREIIPYALGYSMDLLAYFFRGRIDMQPDPNGNGYVIYNEGDEALSNGILELFYDTEDGSRYPVNGGAWHIPGDLAAIPAGGISDPVDFVPPGDAWQQGEYTLVYRGEMGNEKEAVAGGHVKITRKRYLVMKRGPRYTQRIIWDIDRNEPARIKRAGSEEFISYPTNPYGDPDVSAFFLSHQRVATEELFVTEPVEYTYNDWAEESYVFKPNGFPSPCDVCSAEYLETGTLKRVMQQEPFAEQINSTVKELWTGSWDCNFSQSYGQYTCDGAYSSVSGWETIETYAHLPYEPQMYAMRVVGGNVENQPYQMIKNANIFAQNMDAEGKIILHHETQYRSRTDGSGARTGNPWLGDIWSVAINGEKKEELLSTWEFVYPWMTHNFSQFNSTVRESHGADYYGIYSRIYPYFSARSIIIGAFNEEIIFRANYLLYIMENWLYSRGGIPADYEPPLVPGKQEPFCLADSSIVVTEDTGVVNPFTDMENNPELSAAICNFWKTASAEDGNYNYMITFELWE